MLECKKIDTAIRRAKKILIERAEKHGVYENFGQDEVRAVEEKFIDISDYSDKMNSNRNKLEDFNIWCMNYG